AIDDAAIAHDDAANLFTEQANLFLKALDAFARSFGIRHLQLLPGSYQLEVAAHVETITRRYLVLFHDALRYGLVVRVYFLVTAPDEASLSGAVDHLAGGGAFTRVHPCGDDVLRLPFELGAFASDIRIVPGSPFFAARATAAGLVTRLSGALAALPHTGHGDFSAALTRHQHRCDLARPYALTLTLSATLLPARATRLTTRLTPKSHQALHALLPACPLLSQNYAHFLQALEQLFFLLAGHFLLGHAVQVLGRGLEIFRAGSLSLPQVASC